MKCFVWLATLSLLILGIYCGTMIQVNRPVQAAMFSEGSFPSPDMHQGSPAQLAAERGEGAYPTPCGPRPCLAPSAQPKLQAGEGAYPTPCGPRPCLAPSAQPKLQAGEGAYPTPCGPRPCVSEVKSVVALLGDGAAPAPYELAGGMN